jgi:hypothetical protein
MCMSSTMTNKTDRRDITEILLKVSLNTIMANPNLFYLIVAFIKFEVH